MNSATTTMSVQGRSIDFVTFEGWFSRWLAQTILDGQTYPCPPWLSDVTVVLDIGANCGAASVYFASLYPEATVHAFEPAAATFRLLEENRTQLPQIVPHHFGLHDHDATVQLYAGVDDPATSSIVSGREQSEQSETIEIRDARAWAASAGIDHIDILKLDTEGCEVPILTQLLDVVAATTKVVFLEYHSDADRRRLDDMLAPSHQLVYGQNHFETGELTYLARALVDEHQPQIIEWIQALFREELRGSLARLSRHDGSE